MGSCFGSHTAEEDTAEDIPVEGKGPAEDILAEGNLEEDNPGEL